MFSKFCDIFQQTAIERILIRMDRHLNSREEQISVLKSLSQISRPDERIVLKILNTMKRHSSSSEIQYEGCKIIRQSSDLTMNEILPVILHALRTHPYVVYLHVEGCAVLYEMSKRNSEILSHTISPTLDAMTTFATDQNMQHIGCKILGLINIRLPHVIMTRVKRAVIRALELYSLNNKALADDGLFALHTLICRTKQICKQSEACAVRAMEQYFSEKETQKLAMDIIKFVRPNQHIYSLVAQAMDNFPDDYSLQLVACEIFQNCVSIEYNHHILITRALHKFPDNERLHEIGLFTISSLSFNEIYHDELILAGVIGCVFRAIEKWSLSIGVQEAAFHILQDFSVNNATYNHLVTENIHKVMIRAMDMYKNNTSILISICDIITNMSVVYREFFMSRGMYMYVQRIIYCHLLNTDIRLAAECAALALVSEKEK